VILVATVVVASLASAPLRARATVLAELSLEALAERADVIVVARVRRSGSRTSLVRGRLAPTTITVLVVREWLKGRGAAEITVVEPGGARGAGRRSVTVGTPEYAPGETVIAFLEERPEGLATVGMAQGAFRVLDADDPSRARVLRDLRGVALVARDSTLREGSVRGPEALAPFLDRVRRAARSRSR
jgi:hypothetical protein